MEKCAALGTGDPDAGHITYNTYAIITSIAKLAHYTRIMCYIKALCYRRVRYYVILGY